MGTAIRKTKSKTGAKSLKYTHNRLITAANTPVTMVAKWLRKYPMIDVVCGVL